jgi:ankyrin repeat protein
MMSRRDNFAHAIERHDLVVVKEMLANGFARVNGRLRRKRKPTALVHAARFGNAKTVELLLNAGACIDDTDTAGRTACHNALIWEHTNLLDVLLAHRPNLALKESVDNRSVLQIALINQLVARFLGTGDEAIAVILRLIRAGAPLGDIDRGYFCRLAAIDLSTMQLLMDRGVVMRDLRDHTGTTPLHIATRRRSDLGVLSKLLDCGVDLEARSNDLERQSCTDIAVSECHVSALRLFLLAGAEVNDAGADDESLLHKSVMSSNDALMCTILLLAAGADVAARDRFGRTACLRAARMQPAPLMPFVHAMVAAGADLDAADDDGQTPRLCLAECGAAVDREQVEWARREIAKTRLDVVRERAMQVCIGLQSLRLDALQMCEILQQSCGPLARLIAFHQWWKIVTTVKHLKQ